MLKQFTKFLCSAIILTTGFSVIVIAGRGEYQDPGEEQQVQQRLTLSPEDYANRAVQDQVKARRENVRRAFRTTPPVRTKSAITMTPSGPTTKSPYAHL